MKRYLIIAALLAVLVVAAVAMRSTARQSEGAPAYPPVKVALAPALREQAARSYAGVGELEAASQVEVAAETSGRITRILFESGQTVRQGQLLVQLNDAVEQAELVRLQAQLRNADLLLGRMRFGWRGRRAIRWTLAGYLLLILAYFGSKVVLELILGKHWG